MCPKSQIAPITIFIIIGSAEKITATKVASFK